ncbi:MAG: bifunctional serine/threonine-protein kinase/formylglycine-generating enzyme family protein [Planctomycetaceae bacterium]
MRACLTQDELQAFVCGRAALAESEVETHLIDCGRCLDAADGIANGYFQFPSESIDPGIDPECVQRVIQALTKETAADPTILISEDLSQGSQFGNYRIERLLGRGGMGTVYLAEDLKLKRLVALKLVNPSRLTAAEKQRLLNEATAAAAVSVNAPHLATVFQCDEVDGIPFISFQYFAGKTLDEMLRKCRNFSAVEVCRIGQQICEGLTTIHDAGLVHRDLKPQNILLEESTNEVRILDFGLAVRHEGEDGGHHQAWGGTPRYMSAEQAAGHPVDQRSDLFSLGATLYEIATGEPAFHGGSTTELLKAVQFDTPKPPAEVADVAPSLSLLIMELLEKDVSRRPPSAAEVRKRLAEIERELASQRHSRARKSVTAVGGFILLCVVAVALYQTVFRISTDRGIIELRINEGSNALQVDVSRDQSIRLNDPVDGSLLTIQVDRDQDRLQISKSGFEVFATDFMARLKSGEEIEARLIPLQESHLKHSAENPLRIGSFEWVFALRRPADAVGELLGIGFVTSRRDDGGHWQQLGKETFSPPNHPRANLTEIGTRQLNGDTYTFYRFARFGLDVPMNLDASFSVRAVVSGDIQALAPLGTGGGSSRQLKNAELGTTYPHAINIVIKGIDGDLLYHSPHKEISQLALNNDLISSTIYQGNTSSDFLVSFVQLNPTGLAPRTETSQSKKLPNSPIPTLTAPFDPVQAQAEAASNLNVETETTNSIGMKLRLIPAGRFRMGLDVTTSGELSSDALSHAHSRGADIPHDVVISRPFYAATTEVTVAQWKAILPKHATAGDPNAAHPATFVSWDDAVLFCNELSKKERLQPCYESIGGEYVLNQSANGYRLPTEAEWEYMCRAGSNDVFPVAADELKHYCWYKVNAADTVHPVAQLKPNGFGLYDMGGNVWEWCHDWFAPNYYEQFRNAPAIDPIGPATSDRRIVRGADFSYSIEFLRPSLRSRYWPERSGADIGFRTLRTVQ